MGRRFWISSISLAMAAFLTACGEGETRSRAEIAAEAETRRPADAQLSEKFERTCAGCHVDEQNEAPLSGDRQDWADRIADRGLSGLLDNSINGFKGMPPLGACPDCTVEDFEALIAFMANQN